MEKRKTPQHKAEVCKTLIEKVKACRQALMMGKAHGHAGT